ncbi:carboxypeptidase-like regulatory domain-containing protein [Seonamhaeicola sp. NFXS20]
MNIVIGRVTDKCDNNPIVGASVVIKNKPITTITDFEGNYSISPVNTGDVIVVSAFGYYTKEIPVTVTFNGCPQNTPCTRILYVELECIKA